MSNLSSLGPTESDRDLDEIMLELSPSHSVENLNVQVESVMKDTGIRTINQVCSSEQPSVLNGTLVIL